MELKISNRLKAVAGLVKKGNVVADIGTDHGYLPIYIFNNRISDKVIAMDVRKNPLSKAQMHIKEYNAEAGIELRLSDGLEKLNSCEAQTITICGMGGKLIQSILDKGKDKYDETTQLIVSPQSEIRDFRKYLNDCGYSIVGEHMLKEDGQFYFIIECYRDAAKVNVSDDDKDDVLQEVYLRYGELLLKNMCPCLLEYLERELSITDSVLERVEGLNSNEYAVQERIKQLRFDRQCIETAKMFYK